MKPTREQVIEWAKELGAANSGAEFLEIPFEGGITERWLERFSALAYAAGQAASRREHIDALVGDSLTGRKADHICERDGYSVTGVVMTRVAKDGDDFAGVQRCIVNLGSVRWFFDSDTWQKIMFPENRTDPVSAAVAAEREAIAAWYASEGWLLDEGDVPDAIRTRGAGR